jgi:hypothetical protein
MTGLVARLVPVLAGFAVAWWVQGLRLDAAEAEHLAYVVQIVRNAAAAEAERQETETRWKKEVENAKGEAQKRESALLDDLAAARSATNRLRNDASALRARLADASRNAAIDAAAAAGELLAACAEEYRDVAGKAERHANDVRTQMNACPK